MRIRTLALPFVLVTSTAAAEPRPQGFVELELGAGIATVSAGAGLCGSYDAPGGAQALGHIGAGAGGFTTDDVAIVVRAHGTATSGNASALSYFVGAGVHFRVAPRADPNEYWFFEMVPGFGAFGTGEVGDSAGLSAALRAGVNLTHGTFALSTTLLVLPSGGSRHYEQTDLTLVLGLRGSWLSD
jgi:hypothetical protein